MTELAKAGILEVRDPESKELIAEVPRASARDVEQALERAHAAQSIARNLASHERKTILERAAAQVSSEKEDFATLIAREGVKTLREARLEVDRCAMTLRLAAEEVERLTGETIAFDQRPGSEHRFGYTVFEPAGVIVAITPFNDPLNLVAHKIAPAIASGNVVLLKPHHCTPLSALKLASALARAGLPEGILQVLVGSGSNIGSMLVSDARVRVVSFTGGRATGATIAKQAGLKRLSMELGSNCPTIVTADTDIKRAAAACVSGAYWAAGQNCLHLQRLFVHREVLEQFKGEFLADASRYRLGPKLDERTDMGCLISEAAATRIEEQVSSAKASGARVLLGGDRIGTRFAPTVLENLSEGHPLACEEVFGPVTVIFDYDTLPEAIARANQVDYGLQAAIFTNDLEVAATAVRGLDVGAVMVNDSTDYRLDAMPFGGRKLSGFGREGVRSAMREMSEVKVVCYNRLQTRG